jgi:hypothetical protein
VGLSPTSRSNFNIFIMWYFILYVLIVIIGIAVINRLREDNIISNESDYDELSDYEAAFLCCVFWPIAIVIIIVGFIIYNIYKLAYYVIDKIYTKIVFFIRKRNNKTS